MKEQAPRRKTNPFKNKAKTKRNNSLKNKVSGNQDQPKRRNSENQGKAIKKQQYMAKQRKQNAIPLTNQIKSEIAQINWQEKTPRSQSRKN